MTVSIKCSVVSSILEIREWLNGFVDSEVRGTGCFILNEHSQITGSDVTSWCLELKQVPFTELCTLTHLMDIS